MYVVLMFAIAVDMMNEGTAFSDLGHD